MVPSTDAGKGADPGRPKPATPQPSNSPSSKPAKEVTTDFGAGKEVFPASGGLLPQVPAPQGTAEPDTPKPASEVTTDPAAEPAPVSAMPPKRSPSASACEPYREIIEVALARGRNAMAIWQDLVSQCGFAGAYTSVKRFVRRLRGTRVPEAHPAARTVALSQRPRFLLAPALPRRGRCVPPWPNQANRGIKRNQRRRRLKSGVGCRAG